jgi:hypothetical protein
MARNTKIQKQEAAKLLKNNLIRCAESSVGYEQTLLIIASNWHPTSTGLGCNLDVHLIGRSRYAADRARAQVNAGLNNLIADALGYRQAKDQSLISGGYGYSRSEHLASSLAALAGHEIFVQTIGESMGFCGWARPARPASAKVKS